MQKIQISFKEKQYHNLQQYAQSKNCSISIVIQKLLDKHIPDSLIHPNNPLQQLKGIISGKGKTTGRKHNELLYGKSNT